MAHSEPGSSEHADHLSGAGFHDAGNPLAAEAGGAVVAVDFLSVVLDVAAVVGVAVVVDVALLVAIDSDFEHEATSSSAHVATTTAMR